MRHKLIHAIGLAVTCGLEFHSSLGWAQELAFPREFMLNGPYSRGIKTLDELRQFNDSNPDSDIGLVLGSIDALPTLLAECTQRRMSRISIGFPLRYRPQAADLDPILVGYPHLRQLELYGYDPTFGFGGNPKQDFSRLRILQIRGTTMDGAMARQVANFPALESLQVSRPGSELIVIELLKSDCLKTLDVLSVDKGKETVATSFEEIPEDCPVVNLRLRGISPVSVVRILDRLPRLQALDVVVHGDRRELAVVARGLKDLKELHLSFVSSKVAPDANEILFESIGTLKRLETLTLDNLIEVPKAFSSVSRMPSLKFLSISRGDEVPSGMHAVVELISQMPHIESLAFDGEWVNDGTILQLRPLPGLKKFRISQTQVTDDGLRELGDHHQLESLDLRFTRVTQEAIDVLKTMRSLKDLRVAFLEDSEIAQLHAALPNCEISALSGGAP